MTTRACASSTRSLSARGCGEGDCAGGRVIGRVLDAPSDEAVMGRVRGDVKELCRRSPLIKGCTEVQLALRVASGVERRYAQGGPSTRPLRGLRSGPSSRHARSPSAVTRGSVVDSRRRRREATRAAASAGMRAGLHHLRAGGGRAAARGEEGRPPRGLDTAARRRGDGERLPKRRSRATQVADLSLRGRAALQELERREFASHVVGEAVMERLRDSQGGQCASRELPASPTWASS